VSAATKGSVSFLWEGGKRKSKKKRKKGTKTRPRERQASGRDDQDRWGVLGLQKRGKKEKVTKSRRRTKKPQARSS